MKYPGTGSGLEKYESVRDRNGWWEKRLPEDMGVVQALWERPNGLDFREDGWRAVCGYPVSSLLPVTFDSHAKDACPKCSEILAARARDPEGWEQRRKQRIRDREQHRRWREEEEDAYMELERLLDEGELTQDEFMSAAAGDAVQFIPDRKAAAESAEE